MTVEIRPVMGDDGRLYYRRPDNYYDDYDSGADKTFISEKGQAEIDAAKKDWLAAQAAGDQAAMDAAHARAEAVRERAGYSGGANGGAYNILYKEDDGSWKAPSSGGGGSDYSSLPSYTSRYQSQIDELTQKLLGQGGEKFTYEDAPTYSSRYQGQIDALGQQILGRGSFSYDPETDPTYQQYRESYTKNGQRAMQDTLGQVSARTGGLASSYAGSAAQQTYDNYMSALADKIPELRQIAYQMYMDDLNGKRNDLAMLQGLEQSAYNQYLTMLGQYNTDRNFDYGTYRDQVTDQWRGLNALIGLDQTDYNRYRDQVGDQRYDDETSYKRGVYADQTAWDRATHTDQTAWDRAVYEDDTAYNRGLERAQQLAAVGDFSGYQELGYSEEEVQRMQAAFFLQHPELAVLNQTAGGTGLNMGSYVGADSMGNTIYYNNGVGRYSDGTIYGYQGVSPYVGIASSGERNYNGGGGDSQPWNKWSEVENWAGQYGADSAKSYIKEHYKELGYKNQSTALAGWQNHLTETGGTSGGSGSGGGSRSSGGYSYSGYSGSAGTGSGASTQGTITSASQLGSAARSILNHINPTPNYVATQAQLGLKNGTITEAEAEYLLRAVGY